jgi:RNA polymerase sigma factor (sigma-70 family)
VGCSLTDEEISLYSRVAGRTASRYARFGSELWRDLYQSAWAGLLSVEVDQRRSWNEQRSYLYRTARGSARHYLRDSGLVKLPRRLYEAGERLEYMDKFPLNVLWYEDHGFERSENRADLRGLLSGLTKREGLCLILVAGGKSQTQIGQVMGIKQRSVARILERVRTKVRRRMANDPDHSKGKVPD